MTAVEFLFKRLSHYFPKMDKSYNPLYLEAKGIEKQNIKNAYVQGREDNHLDYYPISHSEQYYNETYGNNKCDKCGVSSYEMGKPYCTDDFCNKSIYDTKETEDTFKVWECCGMEDCICELETLAEKEYPYDELVDTDYKGMIISAERAAWIEGVKYGQIIRPTSSKTEVSDEEIYKASEYMNDKGKWYWRDGAKWYREQLKK